MTRKIHSRSKVSRTESTKEPRQPSRLEKKRNTHIASTVARVETALRARGVTLFAAVDHAAGVRAAGLALADEVLLVFGNPKVGTGLMQAGPTVGIELPLRLLIRDEQGTTQIAFSDLAELASRYRLSRRLQVLSQLRTLLDQLVAQATR